MEEEADLGDAPDEFLDPITQARHMCRLPGSHVPSTRATHTHTYTRTHDTGTDTCQAICKSARRAK